MSGPSVRSVCGVRGAIAAVPAAQRAGMRAGARGARCYTASGGSLRASPLRCCRRSPLTAVDAPKKGAHPDLSGYWNNTSKVAADKALMDRIAPNTAVLIDTGAFEYPKGDFGGLKLKPPRPRKPRRPGTRSTT